MRNFLYLPLPGRARRARFSVALSCRLVYSLSLRLCVARYAWYVVAVGGRARACGNEDVLSDGHDERESAPFLSPYVSFGFLRCRFFPFRSPSLSVETNDPATNASLELE